MSAAFEAHRRARESAFVLHGEDVYVSASIHDSVDNLPSSVKLLFQNVGQNWRLNVLKKLSAIFVKEIHLFP